MNCRICYNEDLTKFLDLGFHPPSDAFLTEAQLHEPEIYYPLDVYYCDKCGLVQLGYVVPKEILFNDDYPYATGTNTAGVEHFRQFAKDTVERFKLVKDDLVVDIGSNDGTLLQGFKNWGCKVLGIEPVKHLAEMANQGGIPTVDFFFRPCMGLEQFAKRAKVITATNVFAHVDDLHDFMRGVNTLLADDGVFIVEAPHLDGILEGMAYDTIYHEHLSYLSHYPVDQLVRQFGMYLWEAEDKAIHGGTVRYYIKRGDGHPVPKELFSYEDFAQKVQAHRRALQWKLECIKRGGYFSHYGTEKTIVGVSAPAKGNTLLNYCKIGPEILDYITEKSPLKIGKFTPGMHIAIVPDERLVEDQPDYALLLAWNWADQIMEATKKLGYKGKFIIPLPEPQVIK